MKFLKLGIVICGVLGLVGMFMVGLGAMLEDKKAGTIVMLIAFGLPVVMAVMGLVKPPLQAWQAGVALACFLLELFMLRIWSMVKVIADEPTGVKLMLAGAALGAIASVIAVLKPEANA